MVRLDRFQSYLYKCDSRWSVYNGDSQEDMFTNNAQGLNSSWDDSVQANPNVPPLLQRFPYGTQPVKGVGIGGWLVLEV
jgi:hypothetical protein